MEDVFLMKDLMPYVFTGRFIKWKSYLFDNKD